MFIEHAREFQKDLKRLSKRFPSLKEDIKKLEKVLTVMPEGNGTKHWISLRNNEERSIMKVRVACRSAGGAKEFRMTYHYSYTKITICCLEIFYKGDKEREDKERIERYWRELE